MIYTSYYAKVKDLPKEIVPISISGKAPIGWTGLEFKRLAPKYDFFARYKQDHDKLHYTTCYNMQVLRNLDVHSVVKQLQQLAGSENIALICYEKSSDFCHRHLVADWLNRNGYPCHELYFQKSS